MDRASKLNQSLLSNNTTTVKLQIKESASIYGGLGLIAIGNISAAEDIFFKKQMLIVADDNHLKTTCDNCFMWLGGEIGANGRLRAARDAETVLKRCNSCKVVWYCSKSCQRTAWKYHHKAECMIFAQQGKCSEVLRATVRLLLNQRAGVIDDKGWSAFMGLLSHKKDYTEQGDIVQQAISETTRWMGWNEEDEVVKETYCRVKLNCMAIYSLEHEYLGIGLDPLASLINHSCKPNAYCLFEGSEIRIRSLQRISAGDEITITYIDNTVDKHSRQALLKSRWFFSCTCSECSSEARDDSQNIPEGYTLDTVRELCHLASSNDFFSYPERTESTMLEAISTSKGWPAHIQPLPAIHSNLATSYYAKQNHLKEAHYLLYLCFISDPVLYPSRVHPACVRNLFMLTMVLHKLAKDDSKSTAVPAVPLQDVELGLIYKYCMVKVVEDAQTSHGKQSSLWKALNARVIEEAGLVTDPRVAIALMRTDQMQKVCWELLLQLLNWAGIDPSCVRA